MKNKLPLVYYPDSRLRDISQLVSDEELFSDEFQQLVTAMGKTMKKNNGIGLAAVQIGTMKRLTVIDTADGILPLINPVITKRSMRKEVDEEGCLSIPGVFGQVKRHQNIMVESTNLKGERISFKAEGLFARVIQHEIDHMDGVLFIDRTDDIKGDLPGSESIEDDDTQQF